ncbi:MAG: GH32 C-terminal domain-containing protein [Pirellulales bacterium]
MIRSKSKTMFADRTKSGNLNFHPAFAGKHTGPLDLNARGNVELQILVDTSSVEVFGNRGETVITDLVFPGRSSNGVELFAEGGTCRIESCKVYRLGSVWLQQSLTYRP